MNEYTYFLQFHEYYVAFPLCYTLAMNRIDRVIYTVAMILLAAELAVMIISILMKPLSDTYLRTWGIIVIITASAAVYGLVRKLMARRKGN